MCTQNLSLKTCAMRNIKDRYVCLYVSPCINFCLSSNFTHPINQIIFTFIFIDKEEKLKKIRTCLDQWILKGILKEYIPKERKHFIVFGTKECLSSFPNERKT